MPYKDLEKRRARAKAWREANPDYNIKWRAANPNYHPNWRKNRDADYHKDVRKRYEAAHRKECAARSRVHWAVKSGKLTKSLMCENCGRSGYVEADHQDYDRPLDVRWLCRRCHGEVTRVRILLKENANGIV